MYEGRFAKLFRPATGVITWMSHPAQPSFVWQLYSHDLEPNASLFAVRNACEPVHIQMNQNDWHVMVVNNSPKPLRVVAKTTVLNLDASVAHTHFQTLSAAPSAAADAGAVAFPEKLSAVHFVKLELTDARGRLLSENFYWRALPGQEDDFTGLNALPTVTLDIGAKAKTRNDKCLLAVTVRNPSTAIALMTHLQLRRAGSGQRVLPVFYSDNYLTLRPGERRSLTIEADASDLGGEQPLLAVDGWNVTITPKPSGKNSVAIAPNTDAQPGKSLPNQTGAQAEKITINCGGGQLGFIRLGSPLDGVFGSDRDYKGGTTAAATNSIATSTPPAVAAEVYRTERWGACTYAIPAKKGVSYTVRLHFAETKHDAGGRKFNVQLNGQRVLTDLDIAAEAGRNKALVKSFANISPDNSGHIVIGLARGSADEPKICGIEVIQ